MFQKQDYNQHVNAADRIIADTDTLAATMNDEKFTDEQVQEAADKLALVGPHMMQLAALHLQAATEIRESTQRDNELQLLQQQNFYAQQRMQMAQMGGMQ